MRIFSIKEGTESLLIKEGKQWFSDNFLSWKTRKDLSFGVEDLVVDPTGISKVAVTADYIHCVGGWYAQLGYYGFKKQGYILLVPRNYVEVL